MIRDVGSMGFHELLDIISLKITETRYVLCEDN